MDDVEQKMLEDYDTGRAKKAKQSSTTPTMKPFRCELHLLLQLPLLLLLLLLLRCCCCCFCLCLCPC